MDLAELIAANKRDRSYRVLAADCGGQPSHGRLQQLATGTREWVTADTIRGLARGLGVTERTVLLAVAETMGVDVGQEDRLSAYLPSGTDQLTAKQLAALGALVRSMIDPEASTSSSAPVVPLTHDVGKTGPESAGGGVNPYLQQEAAREVSEEDWRAMEAEHGEDEDFNQDPGSEDPA